MATNPLTGAVLSDTLPIVGQQATRMLNQTGSFTGSLILNSATSSYQVQQWRDALQPWKSVLWIMQDDTPIWNGPVTGWPHQSIMDGTLPIQASTMETFFQYRIITDNLVYTNVDLFEIFRQLMMYALGKKPNGQIAGTGRYSNTSGIIDNVQYSGVLASLTETDSLTSIYDVWTTLGTTYGLEFGLTPMRADAGSLYTRVDLGLPMLGRPYSQTGLQFIVPGSPWFDYAWQFVPSSPITALYATGSGTGTTPTAYKSYQTNATDLNNGYPLLEASSSASYTITSQAQMDAYAKGLLQNYSINNSVTPLFSAVGGMHPLLREIQLGDEVALSLTSPLHPSSPGTYAPGYTGKMRITGWTLTFPSGQQSENIQYQLGVGVEQSL
jgi:hypothetical protein